MLDLMRSKGPVSAASSDIVMCQRGCLLYTSLGFYFDEDQRLVTRKESDGSDELSGPAALREAAEAEMNNITETVVGSDVTTNDDTSAASGTENRADAAATSPEEDSDQGEQVYFPSEEELQTYQNGEAAERITLLNMLYDLADYYQLQNYLCVKAVSYTHLKTAIPGGILGKHSTHMGFPVFGFHRSTCCRPVSFIIWRIVKSMPDRESFCRWDRCV